MHPHTSMMRSVRHTVLMHPLPEWQSSSLMVRVWPGSFSRMPRVLPELQVREHLEERPRALEQLRRLARRD